MNADFRTVRRDQPVRPQHTAGACRFLLLVLLLTMRLIDARAADSNAVLHWTSGDSLPGRLQQVTSDQVTWESGLFADPLQLQRAVLSSVQFAPDDAYGAESDEFRIALTTKDVLFGSLSSLDDQSLVLDSSRHGRVVVPRALVAGVERINQEGLIYLGPAGIDGWSGPGIETWWVEQTDGSLTSGIPDASLSRELPDEQQLAIEFILKFNQRPEFVLALGDDDDGSLRLETWDDALVAVNGADFLEVQLLDDEPSTIHLLLYVNLSSSRMMVCTPQGEVLAKLGEVKPRRVPKTLSLQNGSDNITLQHLRVHRWNGTTVGSLVPGQTGLQQIDGQVRYGQVRSIREGQVYLEQEDGTDQIPLTEIGSLEVSEQSAAESATPENVTVRLKWRDGGMLQGNMLQLTPSGASIQPTWSVESIQADQQGIQLIEFTDGSETAPGPDELIMGGRLLHGHLVVDAGTPPITWKPTGAVTGVALQSGDNAVVKRSSQTMPVTIDSEKYPDTIYLRNNDIIPCRLQSIAENAVQLTSPFATATQFPAVDITAIELSATRHGSTEGFADEQWKRINGGVTIKDGSVALSSGRFGNAHGMISDRLGFHAEWPSQQFMFLTIYLFTASLNDRDTATKCTLLFSENNILVSEHFDHNNPFAAMQNPEGRIQTKGLSADIQLITSRGELEVQVDGKPARRIPLKRESVGNSGVVFELSNSGNGRFFGGGIRRLGGGRAGSDSNLVKRLTLSGLTAGPPSGAAIQKFIEEETRRHTLTIPRFRRDDPPTHALIAPNGDVLRGRLIGIHADSVEFESRLEIFRFPRERVSAVIWISNPPGPQTANHAADEADQPASDSTILQTVLAGGFLVSMTPVSMIDGKLHGESAVLGNCKVPATAISQLYLGDPAEREQTSAWSQWRAKHAVEPDWDIAKSDGGSSAGSELIGHAAPDFELPQLDGKTFRLSDYAGRTVVLDFWATWCGPCVAALPDYVEATRFFDDSELVFVAVNIEESPRQIRAFLEEQELNVRVAIDGGSEVASAYQVNGIPHSVIISPEGIIEWVHVGYDPDAGAEVQRVAEAILSGSWNRESEPVDSSATQE